MYLLIFSYTCCIFFVLFEEVIAILTNKKLCKLIKCHLQASTYAYCFSFVTMFKQSEHCERELGKNGNYSFIFQYKFISLPKF